MHISAVGTRGEAHGGRAARAAEPHLPVLHQVLQESVPTAKPSEDTFRFVRFSTLSKKKTIIYAV